MSTGGGGMTFAFLRATRGGTMVTPTTANGIDPLGPDAFLLNTGGQRLDDTTYASNIAGAKAAGLLTGPYHFGRPDLWTVGDANGTTDSPTSRTTPVDDARHFLEKAGTVMKPGYMRPVYDLEDGNEETTNTQLTNFVLRFNETIKKYKGPSAQIIVYAGTTYANAVNSPLSQFPLWMPRYNPETDWSQGDVWPIPPEAETRYGVWNDGIVGNPHPWNFWQYYSPDVYIPGINAGTHNDIDVAHGDINYVKQFLVQGAIWDGSSDAQWATNANWDTSVSPTGSTEVLFDVGIPPSGATITLSPFRSAGGVYFADSYTLTGGSLSLSDGRIDVDNTKSATIATNLATPNGFRKVGLGTLTHSGGTSTVTGVAQVLQGTMNVSGGSIAVNGNLMVNPELTLRDKDTRNYPAYGLVPPTAGQITSSTLNINGGSMTAFTAYVGGTDTASDAIGTLNVSSGTLAVTGTLKIWNSAVANVDSKVNLSGGTLSVGTLDTNGDTASFNWTGGIFAVTGAGGLSVSSSGPVGSTLTVGTGKTLNVTNVLSVTSGSTLTLSGTGAVAVGSLSTFGGTFNWTGGTLTHNGPGTSDLGSRTIGVGGAAQTLNINGGTVANATLTVGALSSGTVNHTGGTHNVSTLNIGVGGATTGTHNVSGSAILNANGNLYLGGTSGSAGGTGILNISGGTTTTPTLKVWNAGAAAPGGTRLNLSGGTLNVGYLDLRDGTGNAQFRFNFTGGTLNLTNSGYIISDSSFLNATDYSSFRSFTMTSAHTLTTTGNARIGLADGIPFTWNQTGGNNQVAGHLRVGATGAAAITYAISGGSASAANIYVGGSDVAASGPGIVNISSTASVATGVMKIWDSGAAAPGGTRLNLSGGTLTVANIDTSGNPARFNWTGGLLVHEGPGASDLGTQTLANGATLALNGGTVSGSLTTNAGGTINVLTGSTLAASVNNNATLIVNNANVTGAVNNSGLVNLFGVATFGPAATVDNQGAINVNSGAVVAFNAGLAGFGSLNIASGGSATTPVIAMEGLYVDGSLTISPNSPSMNVAGDLDVTGTMDLKNNNLLILSTPLGSWNGSSYTGVTGMLAADKITSTSATPLVTGLAIAAAGDVGRTSFGGIPVIAADVLVMFTYAGDANLSGFVDADDYFQIDSNYNKPASELQFSKGDFDLNGVIDGDDYAIIDASFVGQGAPFVAGAAVEGVRVVPEPAAWALLSAGLLLRRRRRA